MEKNIKKHIISVWFESSIVIHIEVLSSQSFLGAMRYGPIKSSGAVVSPPPQLWKHLQAFSKMDRLCDAVRRHFLAMKIYQTVWIWFYILYIYFLYLFILFTWFMLYLTIRYEFMLIYGETIMSTLSKNQWTVIQMTEAFFFWHQRQEFGSNHWTNLFQLYCLIFTYLYCINLICINEFNVSMYQ